jgi:hypothetical protein
VTVVANPSSFHAEARFQIACAACGAIGRPFHAHHVVDKQTLKWWGVPVGDELYDTRNAMRLCEDLDPSKRCHLQFENGRISIFLTALSDENIEYAFEVGQLRAYDYLHREYAGDDARVELKLAELEMAA